MNLVYLDGPDSVMVHHSDLQVLHPDPKMAITAGWGPGSLAKLVYNYNGML